MSNVFFVFEREPVPDHLEITWSKPTQTSQRLSCRCVERSTDQRRYEFLVEDHVSVWLQVPKFNFMIESPQTGAIHVLQPVGGEYLDTLERLL